MQKNLTAVNLTEMLSDCGLRPSVQRIAVLRYLLQHRTHPTVDEIFQALSPEMPSLSRTTVYNTLHALINAGLAKMIAASTPDSMSRFDSTSFGDHSHFVCRHCGKIVDLPKVEVLIPADAGFVVDEVDTYYRGCCRECSEKIQQTLNKHLSIN